MAQRRMFSKAIVKSEEFTVMPKSSQALYFHLGMEADDDGFVHPGQIMRSGGFQGDDLKILLAKRFLLTFESGVVVIKHWLIHNLIQKDRHTQTRYQEELETLFIKENKAYTDNLPSKIQSVNKVLPQVRLDEVKKAVAEPTASLSSPSKVPVLVQLTTDGEEKPLKVPRDSRALALREKLYDMLQKENGVRPTPNLGDYKLVQRALKHLTESDIVSMVEDAVEARTVHTVREVLTDRQVDIYRQENL